MSPAQAELIKLWIPGQPKTAGSKRHVGNGILVDACKTSKQWQNLVAALAHEEWAGKPLLSEPLRVEMTFYRLRPKSHLRANGEPKPNAPKHPITRPDVLKYARAAEDACTGVLWADDSCTTDLICRKRFGEAPGLELKVSLA